MGNHPTAAQTRASISNGSNSKGPVSAEGKIASAMNGVSHGLASRAVLMPSETSAEYERNLETWVTTLKPSSPGEAEIVSRVADLNFRLRRLQRLEDQHLAEYVETKLRESPVFQMLTVASNASVALDAMITTLSCITDGCAGSQVAPLLSPIRVVLDMGNAVEMPARTMTEIEATYRLLVEQVNAGEVGAEIFTRFCSCGRTLAAELALKRTSLKVLVDAERDRIADELLLGDDKELKRFERHRGQISKALDAELSRIKVVRELAQAGSGSSVGPFLVELKLIGSRSTPRPRGSRAE